MSGKAFQFPLTPVVQLRDREAEAARAALGQAVRARTDQEAALAEAEAALREALATPGESLPAWQLGVAAARRDAASVARAQARHELARRRDAESARRTDLASATRRLEALLDLRQTAEAEHRTARARHESTVLDDLAIGRAGRSSQPLSL